MISLAPGEVEIKHQAEDDPHGDHQRGVLISHLRRGRISRNAVFIDQPRNQSRKRQNPSGQQAVNALFFALRLIEQTKEDGGDCARNQ